MRSSWSLLMLLIVASCLVSFSDARSGHKKRYNSFKGGREPSEFDLVLRKAKKMTNKVQKKINAWFSEDSPCKGCADEVANVQVELHNCKLKAINSMKLKKEDFETTLAKLNKEINAVRDERDSALKELNEVTAQLHDSHVRVARLNLRKEEAEQAHQLEQQLREEERATCEESKIAISNARDTLQYEAALAGAEDACQIKVNQAKKTCRLKLSQAEKSCDRKMSDAASANLVNDTCDCEEMERKFEEIWRQLLEEAASNPGLCISSSSSSSATSASATDGSAASSSSSSTASTMGGALPSRSAGGSNDTASSELREMLRAAEHKIVQERSTSEHLRNYIHIGIFCACIFAVLSMLIGVMLGMLAVYFCTSPTVKEEVSQFFSQWLLMIVGPAPEDAFDDDFQDEDEEEEEEEADDGGEEEEDRKIMAQAKKEGASRRSIGSDESESGSEIWAHWACGETSASSPRQQSCDASDGDDDTDVDEAANNGSFATALRAVDVLRCTFSSLNASLEGATSCLMDEGEAAGSKANAAAAAADDDDDADEWDMVRDAPPSQSN